MQVTDQKTLQSMAERLPFEVNESHEINNAFTTWRKGSEPDQRRVVEIWTYCYVYRYFLHKRAADDHGDPARFDSLISKTFSKILRAVSDRRDIDRYAEWVSVVCKNTYRNHLNRRRNHFSSDESQNPTPEFKNTDAPDTGFLKYEVTTAIDRLPPFMQKPAQLRLVQGKSYEYIASAIGKSVGVARTYTHKAIKRLREDAHLRTYIEDPPAAAGRNP